MAMASSPMWTDGSVLLNNVSFHYWSSDASLTSSSSIAASAAATLPLLIFVHGFFLDAAYYLPYFSSFTSNFSIVIADNRGHGFSKPIPKGSFTFENLVCDTVKLIQHFSPKAPVVLGGHSMGGSIAARVSYGYPDLVRGVFLVEPPWNRPPGEPYSLSGYIVPEQKLDCQLQFDTASWLHSLSDAEFKTLDTEPPPYPFESFILASSRLDVEHMSVAECKVADVEITLAVANIPVPVLLQIGDSVTASETDGSKINPAVAADMADTYPKGQLYFIKNATHFPFLEPTESEWLKCTKEFLFKFLFPDSKLSRDDL